MQLYRPIVLAVALALVLSACASAPPLTLSGELIYPERMALPEQAYARVVLVETTGGDRFMVSEQELRQVGQVPIRFSLVLPREIVDRDRTYGLQAAIYGPDGDPLWVTPGRHAVDPLDPPAPIRLDLQRFGGAAPGSR